MPPFARLLLLAGITAAGASAAPPAGLAHALEYLRDQKSYSWEVINGDPGPVAQQFDTRRGKVTTVQQNTSPHIRGQIDRAGNMLIKREWSDGLQLETIISAEGNVVTKTPEGWLSDREILTGQAEERLRARSPSPRYQWLRRADRPDIRRPDQELVPFLKSNTEIEALGDSYVARLRSRAGDPAKPNEDTDEPGTNVVVTMNVRAGMIRDYEVKIEGTQRTTRARISVPVSEQRLVILTYVPVNRIDIPPEALEKLKAPRAGAASAAKRTP